MEKAKEIKKNTKVLRAFYNNHNWGNAPANALDFIEMMGEPMTGEQKQKKQEIYVKLRERASQTRLKQFSV